MYTLTSAEHMSYISKDQEELNTGAFFLSYAWSEAGCHITPILRNRTSSEVFIGDQPLQYGVKCNYSEIISTSIIRKWCNDWYTLVDTTAQFTLLKETQRVSTIFKLLFLFIWSPKIMLHLVTMKNIVLYGIEHYYEMKNPKPLAVNRPCHLVY